MEKAEKLDVKHLATRLKELRTEVRTLESDLVKAIAKKLPDWYGFYTVGTFWHCKKSPFKLCVYHAIEDRAHDTCVFCKQPEERK